MPKIFRKLVTLLRHNMHDPANPPELTTGLGTRPTWGQSQTDPLHLPPRSQRKLPLLDPEQRAMGREDHPGAWLQPLRRCQTPSLPRSSPGPQRLLQRLSAVPPHDTHTDDRKSAAHRKHAVCQADW